MPKSLKIAVSGAHSTGKSSFLRLVKRRLEARQIQHAAVSDLAVRCPFPILRIQTVESSLWMAATGIAEEIAASHRANIILVDRPVLDTWAYLMAATSENVGVNAMSATYYGLIDNWMRTYDLIYKTRIDESVPVEDNKGRELDPLYRSQIARIMDSAYIRFGIASRELDTGNTAQEVEWLVNYIVNYGLHFIH